MYFRNMNNTPVNTNLVFEVQKMAEREITRGSLMAPETKPYVSVGLTSKNHVPEYVSRMLENMLLMPLDLPIVQEVYEHYESGKQISIQADIYEENPVPKSRLVRIYRKLIGFSEPHYYDIEGKLQVTEGPTYGISLMYFPHKFIEKLEFVEIEKAPNQST